MNTTKSVKPGLRAINKPNPRGVTIMDRIRVYAYANKKDLASFTLQQKQEVGNLIKEKFFNDPNKKNYGAKKITTAEPEGIFKVIAYPGWFCPVIDAIIIQYFTTVRKPKRKRKLKT